MLNVSKTSVSSEFVFGFYIFVDDTATKIYILEKLCDLYIFSYKNLFSDTMRKS